MNILVISSFIAYKLLNFQHLSNEIKIKNQQQKIKNNFKKIKTIDIELYLLFY